MRRHFEEAFSYARKRMAFGRPIAEFQAIQLKLANMAMEIEAARWLVYRAAHLKDEGKVSRTIKYASMAKLFATEVANRTALGTAWLFALGDISAEGGPSSDGGEAAAPSVGESR